MSLSAEDSILDRPTALIPAGTVSTLITIAGFVTVGGLLGTVINTVNGFIGSSYFQVVMGWSHFKDPVLQGRIILQGVIEGCLYGLLFATLYLLVFRLKRAYLDCRLWPRLLKVWWRTSMIVFASYAIGGALGLLFYSIDAELYAALVRSTRIVAEDERLAFVWVGSSIIGSMVGGGIAILLTTSVIFRSGTTTTS